MYNYSCQEGEASDLVIKTRFIKRRKTMLKTIKVIDNRDLKKVVYDKTFDSLDADPIVAIFGELKRKLETKYANAEVDSPIEFEAKIYETEDNEESEDYAVERYVGSSSYYYHPLVGLFLHKESCESAIEMYNDEF